MKAQSSTIIGSEQSPTFSSLFTLSRPHGSVSSGAPIRSLVDPDEAIYVLRNGMAPALVGALPFDRTQAAALSVVESLNRTAGVWQSPSNLPALPRFTALELLESEHLDRVTTALSVLRDPGSALEKVVLARRLGLQASDAVEAISLFAALVAGNPAGNGYFVDLSSAGGEHTGRALVGSSPEVLIRKRGKEVTCHPLAGSAPRFDDPEADRTSGRALADSAKDRREHAFVVDAIREALVPFCTSLDIPTGPTLTHTPQLWHLGTPITGQLSDVSTSALDLAVALHPTPAVCGTPTDLAYRTISELEGERGFYGGAVGWCDRSGDGEWMVAIRCAEIDAESTRLVAYAGGGIVAESDPESELRETITKFRTVLGALGSTYN